MPLDSPFDCLHALCIFEILRDYHPVLVGTFPLGIDVPGSDLDLICEVHDFTEFEQVVRAAFDQQSGFQVTSEIVRGIPSLIVNFNYAGFPIEIFAQPKPVTEQYAYRHLLVEARLLAIGGAAARAAIRAMKLAGIKTEPAFAQYFKLEGDPYAVLAQLSYVSDDELRDMVRNVENR